MIVVGVLLAAGRGERFGGDKRLAPLPDGPARGVPMALASFRQLAGALPDVVAVVRVGDAALAAMLREAGATVVEWAQADRGMGSSLAAGVAARPDAGAWVIALADMPWVRPATILRVAGALRGGASIAVPFHGGARGHPVGFAARHREALLALDGDEGARGVLAGNATSVVRVDVDDPGVLRDVDCRADLQDGGAP